MKLKPNEVARALEVHSKGEMQAVKRGIRLSQERAVTHLKKISPVDQSHYKNAWRRRGERVENDSPHAGIIEGGARPHIVSEEGMQALKEWALRHVTNDEKEAEAVAAGIANKLRREGQKGLFLVRDNLERFGDWMLQEARRELERFRRSHQ